LLPTPLGEMTPLKQEGRGTAYEDGVKGTKLAKHSKTNVARYIIILHISEAKNNYRSVFKMSKPPKILVKRKKINSKLS